jgi:hypothetical protein
MRQEVEEPVADDRAEQDGGARGGALRQVVDAGEEGSPEDDGQERVGNRVGDEVERRDAGDARTDLDPLEAEEEERRPEEVDELGGEDEGSERDARRGRLPREADSEVADEHGGGE